MKSIEIPMKSIQYMKWSHFTNFMLAFVDKYDICEENIIICDYITCPHPIPFLVIFVPPLFPCVYFTVKYLNVLQHLQVIDMV